MVADALVYHPSVAHYLKFVATTSKLFVPISLVEMEKLTTAT